MALNLKFYAENLQHVTFEDRGEWCFNFVYAHDKLQNQIGFDLMCVVAKEVEDYYLALGDVHMNVIVVLPDGEQKLCQLYLWHHEEMPYHHGLVCLPDDEEGNAYALKCFTEKLWHV